MKKIKRVFLRQERETLSVNLSFFFQLFSLINAGFFEEILLNCSSQNRLDEKELTHIQLT